MKEAEDKHALELKATQDKYDKELAELKASLTASIDKLEARLESGSSGKTTEGGLKAKQFFTSLLACLRAPIDSLAVSLT